MSVVVKCNAWSVFAVVLSVLVASASVCKSFGWLVVPLDQLEFFMGGDKHMHLLFSFLLSFTWLLALPSRFYISRLFRLPVPHLLLLLAFSVDEFLQRFSSLRTSAWDDLAVNYCGLLCAAILVAVIRSRFVLRCGETR